MARTGTRKYRDCHGDCGGEKRVPYLKVSLNDRSDKGEMLFLEEYLDGDAREQTGQCVLVPATMLLSVRDASGPRKRL